MRILAMIAVFGMTASGAMAQDVDKCALTETWFNAAVQARLDGDTIGKVRRTLRKDMDRTAAEQLAEFVFALPEEALTPEVAKAARTQCEAL
ncbi:hypothetical protein [Antarctobacter sp.]|uniref:hypothetical protein n=1 Tax=Antarctobacter sp. TaxID=1872577 RepID=UPI003A916099